MTNQELYDAIAFTYQSCSKGGDSYLNGTDRAMLQQLKDLLSVQLDRAKNESRNNLSR